MSLLHAITSSFSLPNDIIFDTLSPKMSATSTQTTPKMSPTHGSLSLVGSPNPNSNGNNHSSLQSPTSSQSKKSSPNTSTDPFLAQYINSPNVRSVTRDHRIYFSSLDKYRKMKSLDIYQKYLVPIKTTNVRLQQINHYHNKNYKQYFSQYLKIAPNVSRTAPAKVEPSPKIIPQVKKEPPQQITPEISEKFLPEDFMDCPIDDIINLISRMFHSLITLNDKSVPTSISNPPSSSSSTTSSSTSKNNLLTRYHSRTPPSISTHTYLTRLTKFNNFNPATLLTTIYYIDLLSHQYQPYFTLNSWTVHRFLLVASMVAQKSMEDFFYTNDHYAKVGGVNIGELNCLELDFLNRIDWRCIPGRLSQEGENAGNYSQIKYAKDVLNLYYVQLIELMGKNTKLSEEKLVHYLKTPVAEKEDEFEEDDADDDEEFENGDDTEDIVFDEESDYYDSEDEDEEINDCDDEYKYDNASSRHLKRKFED